MGKRKKTEKSKFKFRSTQRFQRPDPRFNSMVVTKFINLLMSVSYTHLTLPTNA